MEAGEGTRVPQSRLFGAPIRGHGVAPHGLISEAASLVSIAPTHFPYCSLLPFTVYFEELPLMPHLLVIAVSGYLRYLTTLATLLLPSGSGSMPSGTTCALSKKFWKACNAGSLNGMTPLPGLEVTAPARREVQSSTQRSPPAQGGVAAGSSSRPEIALKSPRTAAGKAQLAAATLKRGHWEGSRGIRLEDPSMPKAAKRWCQEKPPVTYGPERPCFEETYEKSDDSNESFDGPFSGSSSAVAASSTTANTPPAAQ